VYFNKETNFYSDGDRAHDLYLFFNHAHFLTNKAREIDLKQYKLTPEQVSILFIVRALSGKLTPADIARLYQLKRHTVSTMVARMATKGLVKRVPDATFKNRLRICITEKGEAAYQQSTERLSIHSILGSLSDEEYNQFLHLMQKTILNASRALSLDENNLFPL
jgi:DNA-binding MarR family transcriptional regulator